MKNIINISILIIIYIFNLNANDLSKIDPKLRLLIESPELNKIYGFQSDGIAKASTGRYISIIMKTSASPTVLNNAGAKIHARIGEIVTATVALDRIHELAHLPEVYYIQLPTILKSHLDVSVSEIKVPTIWQEYGTSGKGVIIGIIDTGIDWQHQDFRKANGNTRIKYLLDFSYPGDTNNDEILDGDGPFGGTLYTESEINNALDGLSSSLNKNNVKDLVGHGTHVAGCAAGNGLATGNGIPPKRYVGVAPAADLVIVNATRERGTMNFVETDYIHALHFIDSVATIMGKPYVANMSLGGNDGPHDGTSLGEQAIDALVGHHKPGKVVVVSAGNDGDNNIHISGTFTSSITSFESQLQIDEYEPNASTLDDYLLFEMWYDGTANHSVKLISPAGNEYGPVTKGDELNKNTDEGVIIVSNAVGGTSQLNGDNQVIIQLFDFKVDQPPKAGEWKFIISGTSGRFDLWLTASTMEKPSFSSNVDNSVLIAKPGTAKNAITVGAYVTKNQWTDLDGKRVQLSPLPDLYTASSFSSPGPTRDWRTKPEICAPGEMIASSYSVDAPPNGEFSMFDTENEDLPNGFITLDGKHALNQGTSMSAPQVAGVIALIFEEHPNKDVAQIKEALINTARFDEYTLSVPNNKWGYGKIDAYEVLKYIEGKTPEKKFTVSIFQNPALTQYIDFYLISKYQLQSPPTAIIQTDSISSNPITMTEIETQTYKGEYQFISDGTATLSINATIQGEPQTTITKYFGVKLLKPISGGAITFENVNLFVPQNSFYNETYFTILPIEKEMANESIQPMSKAFQVGPSDYLFKQDVTLTFEYHNQDLDEFKIGIYRFENQNWTRLESDVNEDRNIVTAKIDRLGTYQLYYDPNLDLLPTNFMLHQNFPNPFNPNTTIAYQLPKDTPIKIRIFNIKGELVTTLFDDIQVAGYHKITWNGKDQRLPSGMYIYRLTADNFSMSRKMLLLK